MAVPSKKHIYLTFTIVALLSSGCASNSNLTISSEPEGAYITQVGTSVSGIAPFTVYYNSTQLSKSGCKEMRGFEARWASGATTIVDPVRLCDSGLGSNFTITINRDRSFPGFDKDLQIAMQAHISAQQLQMYRQQLEQQRQQQQQNNINQQQQNNTNQLNQFIMLDLMKKR